ncbi:MAG: MFS transporter [Anaerolineae bacterium]
MSAYVGSEDRYLPSSRRRDLWAILVMMAMFPAVLTMSQTMVPLLMGKLHVDKSTVGLIQATPAVVGILLGPPMARLATGAHRRETLVAVFAVSALACWLMSQATTAASLIVPQMAIGLATSAFWTNGLAASFSLGEGASHDAIQAWVTAAQGIGFFGGPLLGGYLSLRSFPAAFWSGMACAVVGGLAATRLTSRPALEATVGLGRDIVGSYARVWHVIAHRERVRVGAAFVGLHAFLLFVMGGSFLLVYVEELGWTSLAAAGLIAGREAVSGLARLSYGHASRRVGPVTLLGLGAMLAAVALALTPVARSAWGLAAIAVVAGVGTAFMPPAANVLAGASADPEEQAFGIVVTNLANSGAQMGLAPLLGWWLGHSSYGVVYPVVGVAWLALIWVTVRWGWRVVPPPRQPRATRAQS